VNLSASKKSILKFIVEKSPPVFTFDSQTDSGKYFFSDVKLKIKAGKQGIVRAIDIICITEKGKRS
jgi:hypothetical protein